MPLKIRGECREEKTRVHCWRKKGGRKKPWEMTERGIENGAKKLSKIF